MYEDDPRPVHSIAEVIRDAMETGDFIRVEGFLTGLLGSAMRDVTVNVGTVTKLFLANVGHRMMADRQFEEGKKLEDEIDSLKAALKTKAKKKIVKGKPKRYTKAQIDRMVFGIAEALEDREESLEREEGAPGPFVYGEEERAIIHKCLRRLLA